uniref:Uncharacterized protein n=1 Tax=Kryptolebias marmoratus TaxID=37003 RepID=A0A3Q2ZCF6_KRYMA
SLFLFDRLSWVCFLLFNTGAGLPVKRGECPTGTGYSFGSGSSYPSEGLGSGSVYTNSGTGFGSGSDAGLLAPLDGGITQMIADLMRLRPKRPSPHFPWTFDHVPLGSFGSVDDRLVYPSSHIVHSSSGYQRARDFRSDTKYTQDTLDHIPLPGRDQGSDQSFTTRGQKSY